MQEYYDLCRSISSPCRCEQEGRRPCDAIMELVDDGVTAEDERSRIEQECNDAAEDAEW